MVKIAPSILSADFSRLGDQVRLVAEAGAGLIHVDVMDGRFVPNLTIGPVVVRWLRRVTDVPLDVHLMIEEPERFVPEFLKAGAGLVSVHAEATRHLQRTLALIRAGGAAAGLALNPGSPLATAEEVLDDLDFVLLMSVNPGFSGQSFISATLEKLSRLRGLLEARGVADRVTIEVDGGICLENIAAVVERGARWMVAGNAVYDSPDPAARVRALLAEARRAEGGEAPPCR